MLFRTRPVDFRAFRWEGQPLDELPSWLLERNVALKPKGPTLLVIPWDAPGFLVEPNQWICLSADGSLFPTTEDALRRAADPVEGGDGRKEG